MPWVGYKLIKGQKVWFKRDRSGAWNEFSYEDKMFYVEQYPKIFTDKTE